jgi:uncharacterized protein YjiS (DUF1127 family)
MSRLLFLAFRISFDDMAHRADARMEKVSESNFNSIRNAMTTPKVLMSPCHVLHFIHHHHHHRRAREHLSQMSAATFLPPQIDN